jgi:filamentous hemagglutinin
VSASGCDSTSIDIDTDSLLCNLVMNADRTVIATSNLPGPTPPPPPGGNPCFAAGTMVNTPDGQRAIDRLTVGDRVYAFDETTGRSVISRVIETFVHNDERFGRLTLSNGTTLEVTSNHRFFDPRSRTWREIGEMKAGDVVLYGYGATARPLTILASEFTSGHGTVYNLEVEKYHNYYVNSILVHNRKY